MTAIDSAAPTVVTMGCRLNTHESERMREHASAAGLGDAVIVNTCAVTAEAVRQAGQAIRRIRREQPHARIIVTGCAAQTETARFADMAEVDHVIGNAEKIRPETFRMLTRPGPPPPRVMVADIADNRSMAADRINGFGTPARAFVEIQNGCDHRCTFCIIPYGRGPSRSLPASDVIAQIRRVVERGAQEVVLTGVDITAWGKDIADAPLLGRLVRDILRQVPELTRLRLSSIDQAETDPELMAALAEEPRLMPHLHLSLQSGSDLILKRMKRRHSRAQSIEFCAQVRRLRPDIAIGADLIAGFPTESESHLQATLDAVDECGLSFLHVFPYSPREGTPAARMPQLPHAEIKARAARLRKKGEQVLEAWLTRYVGADVPCALEQSSRDETLARTPQFAQVSVRGVGPGRSPGDVVRARVVGHDGRRLFAELRA